MKKVLKVMKEKFMDLLHSSKVRQISMFKDSNDYLY
jgi:hypothetical protein